MLTDKELKELCGLFQIKCKGIYLKDQLKDKKISAGFYIYNLDSKHNPVLPSSLGTHWTCSIGNHKDVMYFDSYGVVPPNEISYFMRRKYGKFSYNNYIVQHLDSTNCGFFCLGLALYVKEHQRNNANMLYLCNEYINMFGDDAKKNDVILRNYLYSVARKKNVSSVLLERANQKYKEAEEEE